MDPLQLLQEDLKDDDYGTRMAACDKICTVAAALKEETSRSCDDLIDFLDKYTRPPCQDEAMAVIARNLGSFSPYLVDNPEGTRYRAVVELLVKLAFEEETVICENAAKSLAALAKIMNKRECSQYMLTALKKMCHADWFQPKVFAPLVFKEVYSKFSEEAEVKADLIKWYGHLCADENPMVKKAAFDNLGDFASVVEKPVIIKDLMKMIKGLLGDDKDSMRLAAIEPCAKISEILDAKEIMSDVMPHIKEFLNDKSWRVRTELGKNMARFCKCLGDQRASNHLLPIYTALLGDRTSEQVRSSAAGQLVEVSAQTKSSIGRCLMPIIPELVVDPHVSVRLALSKAICKLAPVLLQNDSKLMKTIVGFVQKLAIDDETPVRCNIASEVHHLGVDHFRGQMLEQHIWPMLEELAKDEKWRVRKAFIAQIPQLARCCCGNETTPSSEGTDFFEKKIQPLMILGLSDHVYRIREETCQRIAEVIGYFGKKNTLTMVASGLDLIDQKSNCVQRMTCLHLIAQSAPVVDPKSIDSQMKQILLDACKNEVSNVRFTAARSIEAVLPYVERDVVKELTIALSGLKEDSDPDVQYYAECALVVAGKFA